MRYVTSIERLAQADMLERMLKRRFDQLPAWALARLKKASAAELQRWADQFVDAKRLEDVFATG